jgi:hypothetical protein
VTVWGSQITIVQIEKSLELQRHLHGKHPRGQINLSLIPQVGGGVPKLGVRERERVAEVMRECAPYTLAAANIIEGTGFWMSTARAILAALNLRNPFPTKTFDSVEPAVSWLAPLAGTPLSAFELGQAIGAARSAWIARAKVPVG